MRAVVASATIEDSGGERVTQVTVRQSHGYVPAASPDTLPPGVRAALLDWLDAPEVDGGVLEDGGAHVSAGADLTVANDAPCVDARRRTGFSAETL